MDKENFDIAEVLANIVMDAGVSEYRRIERIYSNEELTALWYQGRLGDFFSRLVPQYACNLWSMDVKDENTRREALADWVNDVCNCIKASEPNDGNGGLYFRPGADYASFEINAIHNMSPAAVLPYAVAVLDDEVLPFIAAAFDTSLEALKAFRQCPEKDKHLLVKLMLIDATGTLAEVIGEGLCDLVYNSGMTKSPWWQCVSEGLRAAIDQQAEQIRQRQAETKGCNEYIKMLGVCLEDEVAAMKERSRALSGVLKLSGPADEGLFLLRSVFSYIYAPVPDDCIVEALRLLNENYEAILVERNKPIWSNGNQPLIS
jgi:hypothetical protein